MYFKIATVDTYTGTFNARRFGEGLENASW